MFSGCKGSSSSMRRRRAMRPSRFCDLFAGIGGIRRAFEDIGGRCVFTSEWDSYAQKTYVENFLDGHTINGDITQIDAADVPDHDLLLAGFPCQPFSIAGVSKKNALGRAHGFADETQGTLFFDVCRIIEAKQPRAFLLENVKNLMSHDKGRTFDVIKRSLDDLGYDITPAHRRWRPLRSAAPRAHPDRRLPQGRSDQLRLERPAAAAEGRAHDEGHPAPHRRHGAASRWDGDRFFDHAAGQVDPEIHPQRQALGLPARLRRQAQGAGNGFGFGLVYPDSVARTLSARYYKDGSEILVHQGEGRNPRRLTPRECARLMGFPDTFRIPVSDTRAYRCSPMRRLYR
jgi:DNA (cytosine-5)-methyltransferase 1